MKRICLMMVLLAAIVALVAGCAGEPLQQPSPHPSRMERSPNDGWRAFLAEIKPLSGKPLCDKLCRAWDEFSRQGRRVEITKRYYGGATSLIASEMAERLAKGAKRPTLAVLNLTAVGGYPSLEGAEWSERLTVQLVRDGKIETVERKRLEQIIREHDLNESDLVSEKTRQKVGRLVGASMLVMGTLGRQIHVKAVETESGKIVYAISLDRPGAAAGSIDTDRLWAELQTIERDKNPFGLRLWTDKRRYRLDEKVIFLCRAERDCYVTLVALKQDGEMVQLLPNPYSRSNYLHRGETVRIPPADAGFDIVATPPAGIQKVKAIASARPVSFIPGRSAAGFRSVRGGEAGVQLTRDLSIRVKRLKHSEWAETSWIFEITP